MTAAATVTATFGTYTPVPAVAITTISLPTGITDSSYSSILTVTGGTVPYTWSLASGSLPIGLNLSSTGVLGGTPMTAGTFSVSVKVTDANALTATQPLTLTIINPLGISTYPPQRGYR